MVMNDDVRFALAYRRNLHRCQKEGFLTIQQMLEKISQMENEKPRTVN